MTEKPWWEWIWDLDFSFIAMDRAVFLEAGQKGSLRSRCSCHNQGGCCSSDWAGSFHPDPFWRGAGNFITLCASQSAQFGSTDKFLEMLCRTKRIANKAELRAAEWSILPNSNYLMFIRGAKYNLVLIYLWGKKYFSLFAVVCLINLQSPKQTPTCAN